MDFTFQGARLPLRFGFPALRPPCELCLPGARVPVDFTLEGALLLLEDGGQFNLPRPRALEIGLH